MQSSELQESVAAVSHKNTVITCWVINNLLMTGKRVVHKMVITCDRDYSVGLHAVIHSTPCDCLSDDDHDDDDF